MASGLPKNIEAIALVNEGDFDVINKIVIPIPTPEHDQLLIKVEYSGITFADNCFRTGINPVDKWPHILGEEALGKIVSLPPSPVAVLGREYKKRGFSVGQRVVVKATSQMAEYAVCRWTRAIPLPDTISPENAVPMPTQMYTAFMLVEKVYEIKRGDFVLIHSVAREFGLSLLQMAKLRGATVIGMVSTPANAYIARTHGADHVVLRGYTNVVDRVLTITGGQGVHVSYDSVDKDRAEVESDVRMIKQNGTIVVVGNVSSPRARPTPSASPPTTISNGIKICRPVIHDYLERPAEYLDCAQKANTLVSKGFLQPRIHAVIPFTSEAVRQAERDLLGGNTTGMIVVKIANPLAVSPIDNFFARFPSFNYDPSSPVMEEFWRLKEQMEWSKEETRGFRNDLKDALVLQFNEYYGTNEDDLESWQEMCTILGVQDIPNNLKSCRKIVFGSYVNIIDYIEARRLGETVNKHNSLEELAEYTRRTGRWFPSANAHAGGLLRHLLRPLLSASRQIGR